MIRLVLLLMLFFLLFVFPVVVLVLYAVSSSWTFPDIIPQNYDFRSIRYLLNHKRDIGISLAFSCAYSLSAVLVTFLLTILPARLFARYCFTGKTFLEGLLLIPALIPSMTFAMGAHYLFIVLGIADTFAGVVLVLSLISYPYMLRALTAGFQNFGDKYALCARNIGASTLRILFAVELPLLLPAIVAGGSIVFLVSFSEYFLVLLIGGGAVPSYSGYVFPLLNSSDRSVASLLSLIFLAIPVLLFFCIDRILFITYNRRGMM